MNKIKSFFKIDERGTSVNTEIFGGLATFLTMMYILPVNAGMLSTFTPELYGEFFLATALSAVVATLIMGLLANLPIGLAPGMGINAFFAFTVVLSVVGYYEGNHIDAIGFALACVFISGILFVILSVTGLRAKVVAGIPSDLNHAIGAGIGFFVAFLGLQNAGLIVGDPETLVTFGKFTNPATLLSFCGIILGIILYVRGVKLSIIITLTVTAIVGMILGVVLPAYVENDSVLGFVDVTSINFEYYSQLGLSNLFGLCFSYMGDVLTSPIGYFSIFTFVFVDFFDTTGTLIAVGAEADILDENGVIEGGTRALMADSVGTIVGAVLGTSTTTSFVESTVGVQQGSKTGLTSVVVAMMFLLSIALYPVFAVFNSPITAIAVVLVGVMMARQIKNADWDQPEVAASAFITIIFMLLTYSIHLGIALGIIVYVISKLALGKAKEVSGVMYIIVFISITFLVLDTLQELGHIPFTF